MDNIPRFRTQRGWMSEMLNPAAGTVGPVSVLVPMRRPLRFRVTAPDGSIVREQPDASSAELRRLSVGDTVDIIGKQFSADCERWLRLQDTDGMEGDTTTLGGYVWWGSSQGDVMALVPVGVAPIPPVQDDM
eukprot:CAMPEP_0182441002 /NCGR_PEP_ID=MMETSP1167-20130531/87430_1 /TAXON_ID=2988 /ORGANISM="Mallomonas Sp, Strain CCMP3275" /LENGTH=131 /DNA_ID=CAMNT_0024635127 /DNA_START=1884 /DNA_END=2279 /DNA_ORIENTATION=+